ncbi:flavin reductase family protein [Salinisphaera sp. LB1]|uniref:flavin reductase family protein n=1 Tax=Salinisphaera sp. LB1 TaxID=2183911 RepID=UPI000D706130|nr:flavin reductase family protein [Salinisphaera sp. LB1]AWN15497.1 Flavoredoxin [Salinisphaera sp. LB1]
MTVSDKQDFPVAQARRYLEPGPVVLLSCRHGGEHDIMTLGWHTILAFQPSLVGLMISGGNHSHRLIRDSGICGINVPSADMVDTVCRIGNTTGREIDKFDAFGLTATEAEHVDVPLIGECHACFECRLHDDTLVAGYDFFVFEIVKAHVATTPPVPEMLHYTGNGVFRLSRETLERRALFRPELLP